MSVLAKRLAALAGGTLFGAGLVIAGMTDPARVLAFLTVNAAWDPALIFVMASAMTVTMAGYALAGRRAAPWFDSTFRSPASSAIDRRLLSGAALFGVGWGVTGFCPGPALVGAMNLDPRAAILLAGFVAGALIYERLWRGGGAPPVVAHSAGGDG